jgi:glycosyltransferase involved in cell wall biosynthesis
LVVATSEKTRGGISSVIKIHKTGAQWQSFRCKWIETHRDLSRLLKAAYFFNGLIRYLIFLPSCDMVHIHFSTTVSAIRKYVFFRLAKRYHKKIIIHLHCGDQLDAVWSSVYRKMFLQSDVALLLSNATRLKVAHYLGRGDNLKVLYNPCPAVTQSGGTRGKYILFAGTLVSDKGYADLIRAFSAVAPQFPDWKLVIAGNGEIGKAGALAKSLGVENKVVFPGWVDGAKKDALFGGAGIFCFPSYAEGFPMAVLDAWAYGLPVITTLAGGLSDVVKDEVNALVFHPGDVKTLSCQMARMISDEKTRDRISRASSELAKGAFNRESVTKQLEQIYEEVLYNG